MYVNTLVGVIVAVGFGLCVNAQECPQFIIVGSIDNAIIDGCADTIRLRPRDETNVSSWYEAGGRVRLYQTNRDNESVEQRVVIEAIVETQSNDLLVIPQSPLPIHRDDSPWAIRYVLSVDCVEAASGPTGDTTRYIIWKQNVVRVSTEARSLIDSSLVTLELATVPVDGSVLFVRDGCLLSADSISQQWVFNHWSAKHQSGNQATIPFDPRLPAQQIDAPCWPLLDEVMFTAWYLPRATSVGHNNNSLAHITPKADGLQLTLDVYQESLVTIVDIFGNQTPAGQLHPGTDHAIPFFGSRGSYFLVVEGGSQRRFIPFIFQRF